MCVKIKKDNYYTPLNGAFIVKALHDSTSKSFAGLIVYVDPLNSGRKIGDVVSDFVVTSFKKTVKVIVKGQYYKHLNTTIVKATETTKCGDFKGIFLGGNNNGKYIKGNEYTGWYTSNFEEFFDYKKEEKEFNLPNSFCVKKPEGFKSIWYDYINWLNKTYNVNYGGDKNAWYGIDSSIFPTHKFSPFGTELTLEEITKYLKQKDTKKEVTMEKQTITREALKEIHDIACTEWKMVIADLARTSPFGDIELEQDEVDRMIKACTPEQLAVVLKYLKRRDDGSVDLTAIRELALCDTSGQLVYVAQNGNYKDKAFRLATKLDWRIQLDNEGFLCLIPTKPKGKITSNSLIDEETGERPH